MVLLNGVYTGVFSTKRDGVMIRAHNKHQAILRYPDGFDKGILIVQHDDITIRGLRINGERKNTPLLVGKEGVYPIFLLKRIFLNTPGAPVWASAAAKARPILSCAII